MHAPTTMATTALTALLALAASAFAAEPKDARSAPAARQTPAVGHFKLIDSLDRPQDGYCLDIVGSGPHIRFDLPMTAHNCKPGLYEDEAVSIEANGRIRFPAYNACATVAGLNGRALPGAAVVPRGCGERTPFLDAEALQRFVIHDDGRVELHGSGLCMTAGDQSDSTFDASHRWRSLYMDRCDAIDPARARWHFVAHEGR
ncbi:hypothetical protein [Corticibacter populi]|uniref:hypothetical protein n=1 Tax=Corticibacter populi TaxID=1550736 RepID=UPI001A92F420|nr:hypothetical protein [Corticibacter populi]